MIDKKDKVLWTVSIGFMLLAIAAFVITDTQRNAALSAQQTEIATLEQQKKEASDKRTSEVNKVTKNSFGLDTSRVATDDRIATEIIKTATTWSDADSYNAARTKLRDDYKFTDDSQMLSAFMPEVKDAPLGQDGKMINTINAYGLNMTYVKMHSYVVGVNNGVYSYFTVVDVLSKDVQGHSGEGTIIFTYDVDANGTVSNMVANNS
jgi:hypothetical protein